MSETPSPQKQSTESTTSVKNISGGVNVSAEQVNVSGDIVGRDKIVQNIRQILLGPWALVVSVVIIAATALFIALLLLPARQRPLITPNAIGAALSILAGTGWVICLFACFRRRDTGKILRHIQNTPVKTGEPYYGKSVRRLAWLGAIVIPLLTVGGILGYAYYKTLPAPSLILVADFEDRSAGKHPGIDPAQYIHEKLLAQVQKDHLDARVERLRQVLDDTTANAAGVAYNATLVLWGWYDALTITPRVERIKTLSDYQSTEEEKRLSLADPTKVEFRIVTDLPSQSAYIVLLVLGLDAVVVPAKGGDEAIAYFTSAIESVPTNVAVTANPPEAYFYRGNAYYNKGDNTLAIADFNKAIQLQPDYAKAYNNRGNAYANKGDYDLAIADYDKAIQLQPDYAKAYNNRGNAYYQKRDYVLAIADYDKAIQLQPDYAKAYLNRGVVYYHDKHDFDIAFAFNQAYADFDKAIQLQPDYAEAYLVRGNAYYYDKHDHDRGFADYDKAIQLQPDYAGAYFYRGLAYKRRLETERAIADFKQVLDLTNDQDLRKQAEEQLKVLGVQ